jgi:mono/diheme cytochrome c family protein
MNIGKLFKVLAWLVAALFGVVALAVGSIYFLSHRKLAEKHVAEVRPVAVPADAAAIAHGRHIALTRACGDCHGADFGGKAVIEDPMVGTLHGPNITRGQGGLPADFSDLDYVRAIRHGLARDGRAFVLMPSLEYEGMSDEDLGALIAYLKSVAPVDRPRGPVSLGPIGRMLVVNGQFKLSGAHIDHAAMRPDKVTPEISPVYGKYLAASCVGCHGESFAGGPIPGAPPDWPKATNLTPHASSAVAGWTEENFMTTLRTLKRPDGTALNPVMPAAFAHMTDLEIKALWSYLRTLPPAVAGATAAH